MSNANDEDYKLLVALLQILKVALIAALCITAIVVLASEKEIASIIA